MASNTVEIHTRASPEAAWDALRDIGALHTRLVPGFVVATELIPGARRVTFGGGAVLIEPIVDLDEHARRLVWTVTGGRTSHYNASAQVFAHPGGARIVWIADFLPNDVADSIREMMSRGALAMQGALDAASRPTRRIET